MLIFHEGLPGSGKSYEAMIRHVLPALQSGRKVFAFIDGINHERVAECAKLDIEATKRLLVQLQEQDLSRLPEVVEDNAFVILDEAQNYWPSGRQKLSAEMMKFITEHRHRGLDILLMGQLMKDVHAIWRGRVSQKCVFNKLDALGREGNYVVHVYKATTPEKFQKTTQSFGKYDPAMFGMYASHVSDAISTTNYKDARATVWGSKLMAYGLPAMAVIALWGAWTAWKFFHPPAPVPAVATAPAGQQQPARPPGGTVPGTQVASRVAAVRDFVGNLNASYRPRLAFLWNRSGVYQGTVEWWDGEQLRERLSLVQIAVMGGKVEVRGEMLKVNDAWVTSWPAPVGRHVAYGADVSGVARVPTGSGPAP